MYSSHRVFTMSLNENKALFINTLTGMTLILPDSYYQLFRLIDQDKLTDKITQQFSKEIQLLKSKNYIFESKAEEQAYFDNKMKAQMERTQKNLIHFTFVPTHLCNYDCGYCFETKEQRSKNTNLSSEMIKTAFEAVDQLCAEIDLQPDSKPTFHLMGGETLLLHIKPQIKLLLEELNKRNFQTEIITNGHFLSEYMDILSENKSVIQALQVTLDGTEEVHNRRRILKTTGVGNFNKIVQGIDSALEHGIPIKLRMNIDKSNEDISEFIDFLKMKGWFGRKDLLFLPGIVNDFNECGDYNELINEDKITEIMKPFSSLSCEKSGEDTSFVSFGILHKIKSYLEQMNRKNFSLQDCMINRSFVFSPNGKIFQCPVTMHKNEHAIGEFAPTFKMYDSTSRFGWNHIKEVREEKGCSTCATATVCPGPCPIQARKEFESERMHSCKNTDNAISEYLEHYKEEILKLPIFELKDN